MLALAIASSAGVLGALALVLALEAVRMAREIRAGQRLIAREVELQTRVMAAAARLAATSEDGSAIVPGQGAEAGRGAASGGVEEHPDGSPAQ